ncbi:hypothetical protein HMPREF9080_00699 [Cardiobacterium valvarum F0432]|uniref:Uncharacterized protein n=1 Tax=Cardiobacterium valvarum F0432 TaxID=797473 RepID=G9ZD65_9GAMM|nr:hypothetical protein HMPREF9080_00699 [Cardiobacterium valvarum F0432]
MVRLLRLMRVRVSLYSRMRPDRVVLTSSRLSGRRFRNKGGQVFAVFGVFENRRQLAEHHPDAFAAQQLEGAQREQENAEQHQADGHGGGEKVDVAHAGEALQHGVARQQAAAQPEDEAVGAGDEDEGEDGGEQERQQVVLQHRPQGEGHQQVGNVAVERVIGRRQGVRHGHQVKNGGGIIAVPPAAWLALRATMPLPSARKLR